MASDYLRAILAGMPGPPFKGLADALLVPVSVQIGGHEVPFTHMVATIDAALQSTVHHQAMERAEELVTTARLRPLAEQFRTATVGIRRALLQADAELNLRKGGDPDEEVIRT